MIKDTVERISMTLPKSTLKQLDEMLEQRGFSNRSQAITEIINRDIVANNSQRGDSIMAGTITLFYDHSRSGLSGRLAQIQQDHITEVISSIHVQLESSQRMEVVLVKGPASRLRRIFDALITCKGVKTGNLNLTTAALTPIHTK